MELQNFHPIVVHIPIGLLVLYCFIELLQTLPKLHNWDLFKTKVILLVFGTIGAQLGVLTGNAAAEKYGENDLVELHGTFGEITLLVFIGITILYLLLVYKDIKPNQKISLLTQKYIAPLYRYRIFGIFALIGFVLISGTGALGGALVHGPDPLATFLMEMFIK